MIGNGFNLSSKIPRTTETGKTLQVIKRISFITETSIFTETGSTSYKYNYRRCFFSIKELFNIFCNLYIMWDFHVQLLKNMTFVSKKLKICCLGSR